MILCKHARTQTEAMSAIIGMVDSLTVRPFDETFEFPPNLLIVLL